MDVLPKVEDKPSGRPKCAEYAEFLSKRFSLREDEKALVYEICSTAKIRTWRISIAYATAYIIKYGPFPGDAYKMASRDLEYLLLFSPSRVNPEVFAGVVSSTVKKLVKAYDHIATRARINEDHVLKACYELKLPDDVCGAAVEEFRRVSGSLRGRLRYSRHVIAAVILLAATSKGVRVRVDDVARVLKVSDAGIRIILRKLTGCTLKELKSRRWGSAVSEQGPTSQRT